MTEDNRPTSDPGDIERCPVCGQVRATQPFPGCYWGKFSRSWTCRQDNPLLFRGG